MAIAVEADPTHLLMGGGSAWVMLKPADARLRVGLGALSVRMPPALLPAGWALTMRGVMGHASWFPERRGGYYGLYAGYWQDGFTLQGSTTVAQMHSVAVIPCAGYQWFPFGSGLYVQPWLGLKLWLTLAGGATVDGQRFPLPAALPLPGLNVGYQL